VREECLNQHWFAAVDHARELCEAWREDYNEIRPHTSLGGLAPAEFLLQWAGRHARPPTAAPLIARDHSTNGGDALYPLQPTRV
jgi:hypothetical protein